MTAINRTDGLDPQVAGFPWSPDVFMRPNVYGYEIGIRVNAKWWERQAARKAVVLKEDAEFNFGTVCLVLCILPYAVTDEFYRKFEYFSSRKEYEAHRAAMERVIGEKGWKIEEKVESDVPRPGETYEHQYMRVCMMSLEGNW